MTVGFQVYDQELADVVSSLTKRAHTLCEAAETYIETLDILVATGIQSANFSDAIADVPPQVIAAVASMKEALGGLPSQVNSFIEGLDAADADFD